MDASLVAMKDYTPSFASLHNTYRSHIIIVLWVPTSSWLCSGCIGIHFGEPLEIVHKPTKVDGCSPCFYVSMKHSAPGLPSVHITYR